MVKKILRNDGINDLITGIGPVNGGYLEIFFRIIEDIDHVTVSALCYTNDNMPLPAFHLVDARSDNGMCFFHYVGGKNITWTRINPG
jgi:hypothetical protein